MSELNLKTIDRVTSITSKEFKEKYFKTEIPVVITDFAQNWPALEKWSIEYFSKMYGDNEVKVYNGSFLKPGKGYMGNAQTIKFAEYLDKIFNKNSDLRMFLYNIMSHCKELTKDVVKPTLVKGFSENFYFMFFGPKGSETQLHYDIDMSHVFHTNFKGNKKFFLFAPDQSKYLYRHPLTVRSYVNVVNPDFEKYPILKKVKGYEVQLKEGETLFMPAGYWHHIVYEDVSFALSLRCRNHKMYKRLQGIFNLIVMQIADRVINRIFSDKWFEWKSKRAQTIAEGR